MPSYKPSSKKYFVKSDELKQQLDRIHGLDIHMPEYLSYPIDILEDFGLTMRSLNGLKRKREVATLGDMRFLSAADIRVTKGLGPDSIANVIDTCKNNHVPMFEDMSKTNKTGLQKFQKLLQTGNETFSLFRHKCQKDVTAAQFASFAARIKAKVMDNGNLMLKNIRLNQEEITALQGVGMGIQTIYIITKKPPLDYNDFG